MIGASPRGIFVNLNNTIYLANRANGRIQIWPDNNVYLIEALPWKLSIPYSIFVTSNGDIYADNGNVNGRIDKWALNTNISVVAMYANQKCVGVFVDTGNSIYCSMHNLHQVVKRWFDDNAATFTIVAGTGSNGSASNMLDRPTGIFVDIKFDLYVADTYNNRIQLFRFGQSIGSTVAGNGSSPTTIILNRPTGIVLDADKYLYIVDHANHRIVGSGPTGFRCLVGCSRSRGSKSNQLFYPQSLSFDSYGNMFVIDQSNNRIQKFLLSRYACGKF
jgi:hypothetical protein